MKLINIFLILASLIIFPMFGTARDSFGYVASKYEQINGDISTLFYPAKNPKRMVVSFSWAPRNYSMWSWFWNDQERWDDTCYLFISDLRMPRFWYLNKDISDDFESRFQATITHFMNQSGLKAHNLFFVGSSNGGYGALYYGITMGVRGVVVFNPQADRESAAKRDWYHDVMNSGPWFKDLGSFIDSATFIPSIALYVSSYIKDFAAGQRLVNAIMKKNGFFMYTKVNGNYHSGAEMFAFDKYLVERDIMALEAR